jgi:hypothetical protein
LCTEGLDPRDLKTALFCISFLRKGEVLAYVGSIQTLKDLKDYPKYFWRQDAKRKRDGRPIPLPFSNGRRDLD